MAAPRLKKSRKDVRLEGKNAIFRQWSFFHFLNWKRLLARIGECHRSFKTPPRIRVFA